MRNNRFLFWAIALISLAGLLYYIGQLPNDTMPIHFGLDGKADRFGSKWIMSILGILPLIFLGSYEAYRGKTKGNERILANRKYEDVVVPMIAMMFVALSWILATLRTDDITQGPYVALPIVMGAVMVFMSNWMGKFSPNRTFGIRLPWTLKDDNVWRATHRMAGYWGIAGGFVMIISGGIAMRCGYGYSIGGIFTGVLLLVVPPTIFSYKMYHRLHG